jgi:hypothetical protein
MNPNPLDYKAKGECNVGSVKTQGKVAYIGGGSDATL